MLWLAVYGLSAAKSWIRYSAVQRVLPRYALSRHGWFYILSSPLVALLYLYNMVASALELKLYGDRYITNWSPPTKPSCLAAPPQAQAEYHHLLRHVALQCDVRDVFLLGRTESERRSLVGRNRPAFGNTPPFTDLWFSGGEPTLRKELPEIIDLFVRNNGVSHINLPTNGLKPDRIYEVAEHCLSRNPYLELHVNIALDGFRESHDFMRGVPGNFERALESARLCAN